jgi:hypothetical protein
VVSALALILCLGFVATFIGATIGLIREDYPESYDDEL